MNTKKFLAGLLATTMVAASATSMVSAADSVAIKAGKTEAAKGAEFSVDISLSGVPTTGVSAIEFGVNYDADVISITDVTAGKITETGAAAAESQAGLSDTTFTWSNVDDQVCLLWTTGMTDSKYWVSTDGVFVTITGKVNANAADGAVSDLEIVPITRSSNAAITMGYAKDGKPTNLATTVTNGSVSVKSASGTALYGDVDCNGVVDVSDIILLARFVAEDPDAKALTAQGKINADCEADGILNASDISKIARFLARLESTLDPNA